MEIKEANGISTPFKKEEEEGKKKNPKQNKNSFTLPPTNKTLGPLFLSKLMS